MDNQQQDRTMSFFRFEDLRVYAKATDYAQWLLTNIGTPQTAADKSLIKTFSTSAFDIALNIAEGSARNKNQFDHYLKIAKTAIRECIVYTTLASDRGLFDEEQTNQSREYLMELTRMIGALIISLQRGSRRRDEDSQTYETRDVTNAEAYDPLDSINTDF